jgi:hypothetical protein
MNTDFINRLVFFTLLLFFISSTNILLAKENYISGYVILNNGDTLKGFIQNQKWKTTPAQINFKSTLQSSALVYTPQSIKEFRINDNLYKSQIVDIDISPLSEPDIKENPNGEIIRDTVFLQTLIEGKKDLYGYTTAEGRNNYYIHLDGEIRLLIYRKYIITTGGTTKAIKENRTFRNQLGAYLRDCINFESKIANSSYNTLNLVKLFGQYYEKTSSTMIFEKKFEQLHADWGLVFGGSSSSIKFETSSDINTFDFLTKVDFNTSNNFTGAVFLDVTIPDTKQKISLYNELHLNSFNFQHTTVTPREDSDPDLRTSVFNFVYLKMNNMIRFKLPVTKSILFFTNVGIFYGPAIKSENYIHEQLHYSTYIDRKLPALAQISTFETGFNLGLGCRYKQFAIEGRYELGDGVSGIVSLGSSVTRYYCLLSYKF